MTIKPVTWLLVFSTALAGCGQSGAEDALPAGGETATHELADTKDLTDIERALAELTLAENAVEQRWRESLAKAYAGIDMASSQAQRLRDIYADVEKTGGYPPPIPEDAQAIHLAFCNAVAARVRAIEVIQGELDRGKTKNLEEIKELQGQVIRLRDGLKLNDQQIMALSQPGVAWQAEQLHVTVGALENPLKSPATLDPSFGPGDVLYLFPDPNDTWYTGRYRWVDFRGRMAGAGKAPTMKLRSRFNNVIPGHTKIGQRLIVLADGQLGFYCEDRWPENNEGRIRVTVVVMRP